MRGRPRKPTATLKLAGNYRADRHGDRKDDMIVKRPTKPTYLKGEAAKCWKWIVTASPPGVYGEQDLPLLVSYCETWQTYRSLINEGDRAAAAKLMAELNKVATRLGTTPVDRSKLNIPEQKTEVGIKPRQRA